MRVLDVADEDAYAVCFFKRGDAGIECLLLCIGEEIRLVHDAHRSDGGGIRASARHGGSDCAEDARPGEGALLPLVVG